MKTNNEKEIVFDSYWFKKHQSKLLWLANSWIGKYIFQFPKLDPKKNIAKITPNSVAQFNGLVKIKIKGKKRVTRAEYTGHFFSRNEYARKLYFVLLPIWYAMHIWDWFVADHFQLAPQLSFGFSTLTQYPGSIGANNPVDGYASGGIPGGGAWATIRAQAGDFHNDTDSNSQICSISNDSTSTKWDDIKRAIFGFDTSALTSDAIISAVTFSIYGASDGSSTGSYSQSAVLDRCVPASSSALANTDYNIANWAGVEQGDRITFAGWSASAYNTFTLNATGRGNISKTSLSWIGVRVSGDFDNSAPTMGAWATTSISGVWSDTAGTTTDPKLVVTYTLPVAPTVTTQAVSSIAKTTATGNGNVTDDGGATVTERGTVYSTSADPTTGDTKDTAAGTTGAFTTSITGLSAGTTYHVRAYAINSAGTSYGADVTFETFMSISGQVTLAGTGVSGAVVRCIRQSTDTEVAKTTTDGSGNYSFDTLVASALYHICVEYTDGGSAKYNAKSLWNVVPA